MRSYIIAFVLVGLLAMVTGSSFLATRFYNKKRYALMGLFGFLFLVFFALFQGAAHDALNGPYEGFL